MTLTDNDTSINWQINVDQWLLKSTKTSQNNIYKALQTTRQTVHQISLIHISH